MATSLEKSPSKKLSKESPPNPIRSSRTGPVRVYRVGVDQKKAPDRSPGFLKKTIKTGFLEG
jgi:hypothetical protein